jgi:DNA-binding MarR family transcriptional regulator
MTYNENSVYENSHGEVTQQLPEGQLVAPGPDTVQLMEQFRAIAHASHNRTNARMSAAGLSLPRFRVLQALASGGRLRMNELSAALGVVPRSVTTIIDALEKDRMVARLADPADRRATLLEITLDGLSQLSRLRALHDSAAAELFEVLTPAEKQQLARLLRRLQAAADADAGANQPDRRELAHLHSPER